MKLNDEEQIEIGMKVKELEEWRSGEQCSLIGRTCIDWYISKNVIRTTMLKLWKVHKNVHFNEIRSNTFVIVFKNLEDRDHVLKLLDIYLFVLNYFDGTIQLHLINFEMNNSGSSCMTSHQYYA